MPNVGSVCKRTVLGFEYKLKLDKERLADDVVIERDGASVVVDEVSRFVILLSRFSQANTFNASGICRFHSTFFAGQQLTIQRI